MTEGLTRWITPAPSRVVLIFLLLLSPYGRNGLPRRWEKGAPDSPVSDPELSRRPKYQVTYCHAIIARWKRGRGMERDT